MWLYILPLTGGYLFILRYTFDFSTGKLTLNNLIKYIMIRCKIVSCNTRSIITILFYCEFLTTTQLQLFLFFLNSIFNRICFAVWEYKHTSLSGYYTPLVVTAVKPELIKLIFMHLQRARERMTILS